MLPWLGWHLDSTGNQRMKSFVIAVISSQFVPTELLALGWKELFSNTSFLLPNEFQLTRSSVASFLSARVRKGEIWVGFGSWRGAVMGASLLLLGSSGWVPACTSSRGCCNPNPQAQSIPGCCWYPARLPLSRARGWEPCRGFVAQGRLVIQSAGLRLGF